MTTEIPIDLNHNINILIDIKNKLAEINENNLKKMRSPALLRKINKNDYFLNENTNLPLKDITTNTLSTNLIHFSIVQAYENNQNEDFKKLCKIIEDNNMTYDYVVNINEYQLPLSHFLHHLSSIT